MNDDIRVILIKIADRLHNMRTLGSMLPSKQYKIAGETLYIYAPLANRLGLNRIKTELEDLSFKYEHPETYKEIQSKLQATQAERESVFAEFTAPIREQLDKMGIPYRIIARIKSPYSIWNKMQAKHITFEEISRSRKSMIFWLSVSSSAPAMKKKNLTTVSTSTLQSPASINHTPTVYAIG